MFGISKEKADAYCRLWDHAKSIPYYKPRLRFDCHIVDYFKYSYRLDGGKPLTDEHIHRSRSNKIEGDLFTVLEICRYNGFFPRRIRADLDLHPKDVLTGKILSGDLNHLFRAFLYDTGLPLICRQKDLYKFLDEWDWPRY